MLNLPKIGLDFLTYPKFIDFKSYKSCSVTNTFLILLDGLMSSPLYVSECIK